MAEWFDLFTSRWKLVSEAEREQRQRELEDLEFEAGEHWDAAVKADRMREGKPCLTIDLLSGPIKQVTNQQRTARPGIQISAVGQGGDAKKATWWQGIVRRVERLSQAGRVYTWAGQHQVKMGRGCWVVRNQYVGSGEEQDIRIEEVDNQHTVYIDPTCKKLDGSDKKWAIRFEDLTHEDYVARFGESGLAEHLTSGSWQTVGDAPPEWITAKHCRIAEYYTLESERVGTKGKRTVTRNRVQWRLLNGAGDVLDSAVIPGEFIPVVTVFGERRNIDGRVDYRGLVRMAKDPSRMEDFCESSLMETISIAKTAPWLAEWDQISEWKEIWESSNRRNYAVLPYKTKSGANGAPIPPPQRVTAGVDVAALTVAAQRMQNHVRMATGVSDTLQEEMRREQSGKAILARKQSQELGTSDFMENLGDGIVLTAKIIMSMAREVYDTPRLLRIIGEDEQEHAVVVHAGSDQRQAAQQLDAEVREFFDITAGHPDDYDVAIAAGRNYQTARQEAVEMIGAAIQAYPPIAQIALPVLFRNSDFEGAQEIAAKLQPPDPKHGPDPAQLQQHLQQMSQQLQQAIQYIQTEQAKHQATIQIAQAKAQAEVQMAQAQAEVDVQLQRMKDATSIRVAEIAALTKGVLVDHQDAHESVALAQTQAHTAAEAEAGRQHEQAMSAQGQQAAMQQTEAQGLQSALLADQGQGHATAHAEQAAALAPTPAGAT